MLVCEYVLWYMKSDNCQDLLTFLCSYTVEGVGIPDAYDLVYLVAWTFARGSYEIISIS